MTAQESQDTKKELVDALRRFANDLDRSPTVADLRAASGYPPVSRFLEVFGSWNRAKQAAGLQPIEKGQGQRGDTYSDDELLELLRDRAAEVDGPLTAAAVDKADGYPASSTYKRRFGLWRAAKDRAGIDCPEKTGRRYTDDQLLTILHELAAPLDRPLTRSDVEAAEDAPAVSTFERRFGSWNEAKRAAGLNTLDQGPRHG